MAQKKKVPAKAPEATRGDARERIPGTPEYASQLRARLERNTKAQLVNECVGNILKAADYERALAARHQEVDNLRKSVAALQDKNDQLSRPTKAASQTVTAETMGTTYVFNVSRLPDDLAGQSALRVDAGGYRFRPMGVGESQFKAGDLVRAEVIYVGKGEFTCRVTLARAAEGVGPETWYPLYARPTVDDRSFIPSVGAGQASLHAQTASEVGARLNELAKERNPDLRQAAAAREVDALKRQATAAEVTAMRGELENLRVRFGEARERHQGDLRRVRDQYQQALRDLDAAVQVIAALHRNHGEDVDL